jgi:Tfp pilus assembly protein FimT
MNRYFLKVCNESEGTSLIELIVVMTVVAILVFALASIGPGFVSADKVRNTSRDLIADLQWIRYAAITQGPDTIAPRLTGFGVRFESNSKYCLFRFNDINSNFVYDGVSEEAPLPGETSPKNRTVSAPVEIRIKKGSVLANPDNHILIFDHLGIPRQANLGFQQRTIVLRNPHASGERKCVSISFNRIREGEWDGSECKEQ